MDIHSLTSAHLKQAINLVAKKEALQDQLATIDAQISSLLDGTPTAPKKNGPSKPKQKTTRLQTKKAHGRGDLKESIVAELRAAGVEGVSVKSLVEKLGSKSANIHAWFNMTGKRMGGISKIGRGVYRLED